MTRLPTRLYKYQRFGERSLRLLLERKVYFATPSSLNDPLECRPHLVLNEYRPDRLSELLQRMVLHRAGRPLEDAANLLQLSDDFKTTQRIRSRALFEAIRAVKSISSRLDDPDHDLSASEAHRTLLCSAIEKELTHVTKKGILSLAERFDCPLLWSHYGDQHRGICLGFEPPIPFPQLLRKIDYQSPRTLSVSDVEGFVDGVVRATDNLYNSVFFRKAPDWEYEKEWRLLDHQGERDSPFELREVTFGLKCSDAVKYAVLRIFEDRRPSVAFFEIMEDRGSFQLNRRLLNAIELFGSYVLSPPSADGFEDKVEP